MAGDELLAEGRRFISLVDNNSFLPDEYPEAWEEDEDYDEGEEDTQW